MRIMYASDIHGKEISYERLFENAVSLRVDALVLGGDLLPPPRSLDTYSADQGSFIARVIRPLCEGIKRTSTIKVYGILGNDDSSVCAHALLDMEDEGLFRYIHMRPQPLGDCIIGGYSFVPLTPFGIKDWEKFDTPDQVAPATRLPPFFTCEAGTTPVTFIRDIFPRGTIEQDLAAIAAESDASGTIYVFHSPPYGTALDIIYNGDHVGSRALRRFIQEVRPVLTLHGHIHESPSRSGKIFDRIGDTVCINPGASLETLSAVFLETENIEGSMRILS